MNQTKPILESWAAHVRWTAAAESSYHGRPSPAMTYWYVRISDPQDRNSYHEKYVGTEEPSQEVMYATATQLLLELRSKLLKQAEELSWLAKSLRLSADEGAQKTASNSGEIA